MKKYRWSYPDHRIGGMQDRSLELSPAGVEVLLANANKTPIGEAFIGRFVMDVSEALEVLEDKADDPQADNVCDVLIQFLAHQLAAS